MSSYQKVQNLKCRCPLLRIGVFGIHQSHQIPNIPCDRAMNDVFLNQHLQWYHNFDSVAARKLVRAICNNVSLNEPLFSIHETIIKQNVSVESYKCKCPLTHDGAFGLSDEHEITNVPCGRAEKEVLCFQHLQYHHNLSSRAAKKIVLAVLSYTPTITQLFHNDDLVTQSKCAVRKLKSKCPLLSRHVYGLSDQHQVANIPCDRADQHIFLFHHLTYFHKLNGKAATKLIRAVIMNKDPSELLFHYNETVVVSNNSLVEPKIRRTKKSSTRSNERNDQLTYSNPFDPQSKYQCLINPSALSTLIHRNPKEFDVDSSTPLDYTRMKNRTYPPSSVFHMSYPYTTIDMSHAHALDLNYFSHST